MKIKYLGENIVDKVHATLMVMWANVGANFKGVGTTGKEDVDDERISQ